MPSVKLLFLNKITQVYLENKPWYSEFKRSTGHMGESRTTVGRHKELTFINLKYISSDVRFESRFGRRTLNKNS